MIENKVEAIYSMLLNKEYQQIESLTQGIRLNAKEIENSILDYGFTLVPYPETIELDIIEIAEAKPKSWSIVAPVYTKEEGLSDLSIELTLVKNGNKKLRIELDNIHVS